MSSNPMLHLTGTLHRGRLFLELRPHDGAFWDLDPTSAALRLVGQDVEVIGRRGGFNDLICEQIWPAGQPRPEPETYLTRHHVALVTACCCVLAVAVMRLL